jgi:hypothetical protein
MVTQPRGRPHKFTSREIVRRTIEIIRCIGPAASSKVRVATIFWSLVDNNEVGPLKKGDRMKLIAMCNVTPIGERRKYLRRYNEMLRRAELGFELILGGERATARLRRKPWKPVS